MPQTLAPVGVREAKNRFSELTSLVNDTGASLVVLKNNRPWVTIEPSDAASADKRRRLESFRRLTRSIEEGVANEPAWNPSVSDRDLLNEERSRRYG